MEPQGVKFQCSLYADDVILFIRPTAQEARVVKEILTIFGDTTGIRTNLSKCSITPIFGGKKHWRRSCRSWAVKCNNFESDTLVSP
jgi:hypothetical protein